MIRVREENNFQDLVKNKEIVIPIIQRDYAQGRDNSKARVVRTRLIDEWIDILQDKNLRMDFNYIYGNGDSKVFYPVDGQQRLTSLYLLHWYLAQATENTKDISEWQFNYKTRNSASEFFTFLREPDKSKDLFCILSPDANEDIKRDSIRNESWFKTKWENDPTVVSCVNFLCMLSVKLSKYESQFNSFYERLKDSTYPAVYFTCLNECDDQHAEIDAAKKYTRMNARGKRLSNFENIKAMIDDIEMKNINKLKYCCTENQDKEFDTISWAYDRTYIDCMFRNLDEKPLLEKTKEINDESENWFKLIYYVYALVNKSTDLLPFSKIKDSYEEIIYKISQERVKDDDIVEYLYMIKAVFEVLYNSKDKIVYRYDKFTIRKSIAFILFVSRLWDKSNRRDDNLCLINKWVQFKNMLNDLCFDKWKVSDESEVRGDLDISSIVIKMLDSITKTTSKSVDEYFVCNDFTRNSPFKNDYILPDIKCRIIERKIKAKLICDGASTEDRLNKAYDKDFRGGYLYYSCGFLNDWKADDWSKKATWDGEVINDYIDIISSNSLLEHLMTCREAKIIYAYSSQYNQTNKRLNDAKYIDMCNNQHIWNEDFLIWKDDEYNSLEDKKKKQMDNFKVMLDLLLEYKKSSGIYDGKLINEYASVIYSFFDSNSGYETCWLRFAVKYATGGKELLTSKLEVENGVVKIGKVPVIMKTYLVENGYPHINKVSYLKDFSKKCNYFTEDESKVPFSNAGETCKFVPDLSNSGRYQHSKKTMPGWDLSGNIVTRNMDLQYKAYLNLSRIGKDLKNNFWSIDINNGTYTIKVYEIRGISAGKLSIIISEAIIDKNTLNQAENNVKKWQNKFGEVENSPFKMGNYDCWIELWNNEYVEAFGSSFEQNGITYDKKEGQRPKKKWSEVLSVPTLTWSTSTINI